MADNEKNPEVVEKPEEQAPAEPPKAKDRTKANREGAQTKEKKKKQPGKIRRWFKDFFSELKKVTWPSFTKVLKQTGTVLLVTVCFLLVLMAFDSLLGYLYGLLVGGLSSETVTAFGSAVMFGGGGLL